jgi:twitching motility protein PilI
VRPSQRKVLVIDQPGFFSGLVIDAVLGIQQFTSAQYRAESLPSDSPLAAYSHGKFVKDEQEWFVFMPSLLVQDQRYVEAAI